MEKKDQENISLKRILVKYLRRWKLFLCVFIVSFIPAILYLKLYPRTYEFATSILLQDENDSPVSGLGLGTASGLMKSFGIGASGSSINVDDEMEILASNRLFRMMVQTLGVNVNYSTPFSLYKMYQEAPLKLSMDSAMQASLRDEFRFAVSVSPGQVKVNVKSWPGGLNQTFTYASLPAVITLDGHTFVLDFDHDGSSKNTFKLKISVSPVGWMAETLIKKTVIEDVTSASHVLVITYSDHAPQRGLDILHTLINEYNRDMETFKQLEAGKTMTFVNNRISDIVMALEKVEANLQDFKTKNDITSIETDVALYSELFKGLKTSYTETEMKAYSIDLLDSFIKDPENRNKAIPSVFSVNEGEKGIIFEYNKVIGERERLLVNSNETNLMVQMANTQVDVYRESVIAMIGNARESINKELSALKAQENELMKKFKSVPGNEREYLSFVRDQEILHGIYLLMLQKREETILAMNRHIDRARMIEPPYIKKKPLGPRRLYAGIAVIILTLVVPVGYLFAKDLFISIKDEMNNEQ